MLVLGIIVVEMPLRLSATCSESPLQTCIGGPVGERTCRYGGGIANQYAYPVAQILHLASAGLARELPLRLTFPAAFVRVAGSQEKGFA